MIRRWQRRLRYWLHSGERARLLREEMEIHLEMRKRELIEDGMGESDALAAARRQFGNFTLKQEESRCTWIPRWLSDFAQDSTYAFRAMRAQPGFVAVAVLSTVLGVGACSMVFGIANFALFRPLPVDDPSRLVSISGKNVRRGKVGQSLSYPDFEDLRQARSFAGVTAFFSFMPASISTGGEPERYWGSLVTANYFDVLRPTFIRGRGFDAAKDDRKGESPVVVLSHRLWLSRFGGDPDIVGRLIEMNRRKVAVVGVTGPGFRGSEIMFFSDFWLPFSMAENLADVGMRGDRFQDRGSQWLMAAARLREGVNLGSSTPEVEVIADRLRTAYPATNKNRAFHIERAGQVNPGFRKMAVVLFVLLLSIAALVLFTACANVANLLLARASARHKEIATRLAIGASRGRLIRQLLTESALLALLGGAGGYGMAQLGASLIGKLRIPLALPVDFSISLDYRVVIFSIALSALTGLIFGLVPALRATRPDLVGALKDDAALFGASRRFGLRKLLVVVQVAICMVLLICSGLFLRSFVSARRINPGFSHRNLLLLAFDPGMNRYSPAQARQMMDAMVNGVRALPGVESASLGSSVPLNMEGTQNAFTAEDALAENETQIADIYSIAPGYFETFGIPLIGGEDFPPGEPAGDIAIVNRALVAKAFGNKNPIGRRISYQGRMVRIAGVVETAKSRSIGEEPRACLYFPIARDPRGNDSLTGITLVVRTAGDPSSYAPAVRQTIREIDPALAIFDVRTMEAQLHQAMFFPRMSAYLFGLAGCMGLLIASIGIYGVISFAVARQTREIGIRMALGARRGQVLCGVLRQGLTLTATGSAIGLGLSLALSRIAANLLYGVSATDAVTFIGVPLLLMAIAMAACLAPAKRAVSLDPLRALRYE